MYLDDGMWHIDLKNGGGSAGQGAPDSPDVTMTLSKEDFQRMFAGYYTFHFFLLLVEKQFLNQE